MKTIPDELYACVLLKVYSKKEPCKYCGKLSICTQTYRSWDIKPMCEGLEKLDFGGCCDYKEKPDIEYYGSVLKLNILPSGPRHDRKENEKMILLDFDNTKVSDYRPLAYFQIKIKNQELFYTYESAFELLKQWHNERTIEVSMTKLTDETPNYKSINKHSFFKSTQGYTNFIYFKDDLPKEILNNILIFDRY